MNTLLEELKERKRAFPHKLVWAAVDKDALPKVFVSDTLFTRAHYLKAGFLVVDYE